MTRRIVSGLALLVLLGASGASDAARRPPGPSANVLVVAVRVVVPGRPVAESPPAPVRGGSEVLPSFVDPGDGSIVVAGVSSATDTARAGATPAASGASSVDNVSLFDGEITADAVSGRASVEASAHSTRSGPASGAVVGLQALGRRLARGTLLLGDWGALTVAAKTGSTTASRGAEAYQGSVAGLALTLLRPHDGLPAGSEIELGFVGVGAATPPPPPPPPRLPPPELVPGDRPQLLPPTTGPLLGVPQVIEPPLGGGRYVFPVYGSARVDDDFGSSAGGSAAYPGLDILGQLGEPVLAVATGTLYGVGWNRFDGNRLWLRDRLGNEFFYARLSAFSPLTAAGAHVTAGEVIGFMGDTGDPSGLPTHLEFQVHPVSLLYLVGQGVVDPSPYLARWPAVTSIALAPGPGWAPSVPGTIAAPEPGAYLLSSSALASLPSGATRARRGGNG